MSMEHVIISELIADDRVRVEWGNQRMLIGRSDKVKEQKGYRTDQNMAYVLKKITKWQAKLVPISIIHIICKAATIFIMPFLIKIVIDQIQNQRNVKSFISTVMIYTISMLFIYLCNGYCESQEGWRNLYLKNKFLHLMMSKLLTMDYENLESPKVLNHYQKIREQIYNSGKGIQGMIYSLNQMSVSIIQVMFSGIILSGLSPLLTLIVLLFSFIQFIPVDIAKKRNYEEVWNVLPPTWRKVSVLNWISGNFEYAKEIRMYHMANWIHEKHKGINEEIQTRYMHSRNLWLCCNLLLKFFSMIQEIILYAWLVYCLFYRELSIGNFTLYVASVRTFSTAFNQMMWEFSSLRLQSLEVNDFREFIEYGEENTRNDGKLSVKEYFKDTDQYEITFDHVSFCYEGQSVYALKDLNLTLKPGKRLALVGLNGAGKTTMIKLLCRLYDPTEGRILLNGIDIKEFDKTEYFNLFSPVFQNVELYAFPIAENVSMKLPIKTDIATAEKALEDAGLNEKIKSLSKGVNTELLKVLYEDGVDFSGGERQKLALARALYKDAPIILLDEPTAALDAIAEYNLYKNFDELIGNKTAIYISHRLASTRFCHEVAMFEHGELVELGTHEELLMKEGPYSNLFNIQAQYYQDEEMEVIADV